MTLAGWGEGTFTYDGTTRTVFRRGDGPGVIVIHELPGITPAVVAFADDVVAAGFHVVLPSLVGTPGRAPSPGSLARSLVTICVSREFTTFAVGRTSPVTVWLRALARQVHAEQGGPGVGAVGMCFSGGFALAMVDDHTVAPVVSQPSLPFAVGRTRAADLGLSPRDLDRVLARVADGCEVLGLRYTGDRFVGTRFATLQRLLGDRFLAVEFPSRRPSDHSVLTEHRQEEAVAQVIAFLRRRLAGA